MKRRVSICQMIDCRSNSGLRIELMITEPLNSFFLHFCCTIETNEGSFKSCYYESTHKRKCSLHIRCSEKLMELQRRYVVESLN